MRTKAFYFVVTLAMLACNPAWAQQCPRGSTYDSVKKICVPDENVTIIIDPAWLVAGGVALVFLVLATIYLISAVRQLTNKIESQKRIG